MPILRFTQFFTIKSGIKQMHALLMGSFLFGRLLVMIAKIMALSFCGQQINKANP